MGANNERYSLRELHEIALTKEKIYVGLSKIAKIAPKMTNYKSEILNSFIGADRFKNKEDNKKKLPTFPQFQKVLDLIPDAPVELSSEQEQQQMAPSSTPKKPINLDTGPLVPSKTNGDLSNWEAVNAAASSPAETAAGTATAATGEGIKESADSLKYRATWRAEIAKFAQKKREVMAQPQNILSYDLALLALNKLLFNRYPELDKLRNSDTKLLDEQYLIEYTHRATVDKSLNHFLSTFGVSINKLIDTATQQVKYSSMEQKKTEREALITKATEYFFWLLRLSTTTKPNPKLSTNLPEDYLPRILKKEVYIPQDRSEKVGAGILGRRKNPNQLNQ